MGDNAPMAARIGFLAVDVDVTSYDLASETGHAAARVTVDTGVVDIAGGSVSGAVDVTRLLGADPDQGSTDPVDFTATRSMSASAGLTVQDSPDADGVRPLEASGTIGVTWASLAPGRLPSVTTDED